MTKKKYSIKETINYDVCECVYCGHIFNGREAMNGDMDKSSVECPNCEKEMKPAWQEAKVKISKPDSDLNSKIDADFGALSATQQTNIDLLINVIDKTHNKNMVY